MWSFGEWTAKRPRRWLVCLVALPALLLVGAAIASARLAQGRTFPSFLADPYGSYSSVELDEWRIESPRLHFPDKILRVGDVEITHPSTGQRFHQELASALAVVERRGLRAIRIVAAHDGAQVSFQAPLRRIGQQETLVFFVNYLCAGVLHLWLGLTVLATSPPARSVAAYLLLSVGAFGFLVTFFDYHTTEALAPVFHSSAASLVSGFFLCAYEFPEAPRSYQRLWALLLKAGLAVMVITGLGLLLAPLVSLDSLPLRVLVTAAMPASIFVLALSLAARWANGGSNERKVLRAMLPGFLFGPAATAIGFPLTLAVGGSAFHLVLPCASLMMTGSLGVALVRTNVFRTTAIFRRVALLLPAGVTAIYVGTCIWFLFQDTGGASSLKVLAILTCSVIAFVVIHEISRRVFFRSTYLFRRTLEALGRELAGLEDPAAIEAIIRKRLEEVFPHAKVRLASWSELKTLSPPQDLAERLQEGQAVWLPMGHVGGTRLLPIGSGDAGPILVVAQREGFALHTTEDLALMDAMVLHASLALKSAKALREAAAMRRIGVQSALNDKELTLSTLFAEVAHEIAYPLSYFRFLLARVAKGTELSKVDVDVGQEEVARLERMLRNLRARKEPELELVSVNVADAARRAVELIRADPLFSSNFEIQIPENVHVRAGRDQLLQLLANLIRNGANASPAQEAVVIKALMSSQGVFIEVHDRGDGVPEEMREKIFTSWVSTTEGGTGLGLTTCQRITLRFGWSLDYERVGEWSIFRISVPPSAVVDVGQENLWKS
jgi:signal transduction histidine kinase